MRKPIGRRTPLRRATRSKTTRTAGLRQAIIYRGEDGYWVAECPSLPGCVSQGASREAAVRNIHEAAALYVEALEADGLPVPPESFDAMVVAV